VRRRFSRQRKVRVALEHRMDGDDPCLTRVIATSIQGPASLFLADEIDQNIHGKHVPRQLGGREERKQFLITF
jgi:hypothetical protein